MSLLSSFFFSHHSFHALGSEVVCNTRGKSQSGTEINFGVNISTKHQWVRAGSGVCVCVCIPWNWVWACVCVCVSASRGFWYVYLCLFMYQNVVDMNIQYMSMHVCIHVLYMCIYCMCVHVCMYVWLGVLCVQWLLAPPTSKRAVRGSYPIVSFGCWVQSQYTHTQLAFASGCQPQPKFFF